MNLTDKVPKRLQRELRHRLRAVWNAPSRRECELRRDEIAHWLHARGQDPAAETLFRDWDNLVTFYDDPAEHWIHLRTSNPVESVFAGVRLRTNGSKRMRRRDSAPYLVFKITQRLELGWRPLNGGTDAHDPAPAWRSLPRRHLHPGRRRAPRSSRRGGVSGMIHRHRALDRRRQSKAIVPGARIMREPSAR